MKSNVQPCISSSFQILIFYILGELPGGSKGPIIGYISSKHIVAETRSKIKVRWNIPATRAEMKYPRSVSLGKKHWGQMLGLHPCWPDVAFGKDTKLSRYVFMSHILHLVWATHLYILMYFQNQLDYCFQKCGYIHSERLIGRLDKR